jgi:4'-phosphopantetheinyl transferase
MKATTIAPTAGKRDGKEDPREKEDCRRFYFGVIDCASTAFDEAEALPLLDGAERERLARYSRGARGREYLAGRLMAKRIASRLLGIEAERVAISVGGEGKPALPEGLELGIAHSRGLVLCAVAPYPPGGRSREGLGIDIEKLRPREGLEAIAAFAFSENERGAAPDDMESFYILWTLKEAWLKRLGAGLGALASAPAFELGPEGRLRVRRGDAGGEEDCECLCLGFGSIGADARPAYVAAAALGRSDPEDEVVFDDRFAPPPELAVRTLFSSARAARLSAR